MLGLALVELASRKTLPAQIAHACPLRSDIRGSDIMPWSNIVHYGYQTESSPLGTETET
jgi:hypothetical protein